MRRSRGPGDQPVTAGELGTCGGRPIEAPRQLRGMWLTTVNNIDWPSRPGLDTATVKAEYQGWLDLAQRQNHNAIFVHVRPSGDALLAVAVRALVGVAHRQARRGRSRAGTRWSS